MKKTLKKEKKRNLQHAPPHSKADSKLASAKDHLGKGPSGCMQFGH